MGIVVTNLMKIQILMVGSFYAKRESIAFAATTEVPLAYEYLLSLYKNYDGPHDGIKDKI